MAIATTKTVVLVAQLQAGVPVGFFAFLAGVDPMAVFGALMGAIVWTGITKPKDINASALIHIFSWMLAGLFVGTFGGEVMTFYLEGKYPAISKIDHSKIVALTSFIIAFTSHITLNTVLRVYRQKVGD